MAVQNLNLRIAGLNTNSNELASAELGSLLVAKNIEIFKPNVAEPRRGFERYSTSFSDVSYRPESIAFYQDILLAAIDSGASTSMSYYNSGTWTTLGSGDTLILGARANYKNKFCLANSNIYISTIRGIKKLDAYNGTPSFAGIAKALDLQASTTGSSGFLTEGYQVAYRLVWKLKDANGNYLFSAPSQRAILTNATGSGSTKNGSITSSIPSEATTSWYYQLYRSAQFTESETPNDELQLVKEGNPDSTDITNKYFTVTDSTIDAMRGATIYTAPSQEGIANQNDRPPEAIDIALFNECTFYANTYALPSMEIKLVSVEAGVGLQNGDVIRFNGTTFTGSTVSEGSNIFFITTGTTAAAIEATAKSLVKIINRSNTSGVYAYYISGPTDEPGRILVQLKSLDGNAIADNYVYVSTTRAAAWFPTNIPTSGTTFKTTAAAELNKLVWSKPSQPEHVPLPNFAYVGSANKAIQRIIALREALIILKDDGVFRLTGSFPSFNIEKMDDCVIIGPETAININNEVMMLSDRGIVSIGNDVVTMSQPIAEDIKALTSQALTLIKSIAFGAAYEKDHKYYLFLPESSTDTYCKIAYVFNTITQTWVLHELNVACAIAQDQYLYLGSADSSYILRDRKNYTYIDYADFGFSTTISDISGTTFTITDGVDNISVGDILYQSSTIFSVITAISPSTGTFTVYSDPGFTAASADILYGIDTDIKWAPITSGNPGVQKQYHTVQALFKEDFTGEATLAFSSDLSNGEETVTLTGASVGAWGLFTWGDSTWGGTSLRFNRRQWIPRAKQRSSELLVSFRHRYGFSAWQLQGLSLTGQGGSENTSR